MSFEHDAYRLLFEANPRPMYVAARDSLRILIVNRAACELYEWTREEMLAMTLRDIRPVEEIHQFEAAYSDATKDVSKPYGRAARHCTKSGRVLDVTLEISSLVMDGRSVSLAVVTEVTGIAQAERRFQLLVEHSADGIVLTNENNIVEYVSPGGERILGYPDGAVGKPASTRLHPDDRSSWTPPAPGETRYYVARAMHYDGSWRWLESSTTNLTHDPAVRAYVANYRDITARKLAEDALVASEANFRALIERSPMAIFVHHGGRHVYVNPAAVAMLGYQSADEIIGRSVLEFIHPDDRELVRARVEQTSIGGGTPPGAGRMLRADGSVVVIEAEGIRLDFDGQPSNVVMGQDVTQRHEVFARMAMADRMLTVGTLAAGVAHEINNPLAYIATNIDVLSAELPVLLEHGRPRLTADDFRRLVSDVREGVARVSTIVRDLLALSRQDDDTREPVDVVAVLAQSIKMAHNELRHRARVVQSYADEVPLVDGHASKLGQVFLNLLLNAAHAITDGGVDHNEVRVRARACERGVVVEIEDTGSGIAPQVMPRIFDPFFTTKARGVGTGLGLSISDQIVRSMGGEITVESTVGRGSTFRVTLPAATVQRSRVTSESDQVQPLAARVLVIDDEVAVGRSLRLLLAPENDVVAVTSGRDALTRLEAGERFDAILCDLMMPDVSGIELYTRLARIAPAQQTRIIFMTGGAFTEQARDFLATVDRPRLDKPFTEGQVRHAIERAMR